MRNTPAVAAGPPETSVPILGEADVLRGRSAFRWFARIVVLAITSVLFFVNEDVRAVWAPIVATVTVTLFYLAVLVKRDGHLPIFEAATYFVLATAIYTTMPLVQFLVVGMEWVPGNDYRLVQWSPVAKQFGAFAWRHVVLLATFVLIYLLVRGKRLWKIRPFAQPSTHQILSLIAVVLACSAYLIALETYVGPTVSVYAGGTGAAYLELPRFVQQIANVAMMVRLTLKQCLVVILLGYWSRRAWRMVLLLWLVAEVTLTVTALETRTSTVLLLLTFVVGYHLIVKPISMFKAFTAGAIMLAGFVMFGVMRDFGVPKEKAEWQVAWGGPNEFQILYGNAYDIYRRKMEGSLPQVPPQMVFADFYRVIPSQILPFYKWEPSIWYKDEVLELRDSAMGFMFGIVAQSVLGGDWVELVVRAILLALLFATAHRTWRRYSGSFWATISYLFVLTWAYYAFRSSSFEILYRFVYYLAPAAIAVKLLTAVVSVPVRASRNAKASLST